MTLRELVEQASKRLGFFRAALVVATRRRKNFRARVRAETEIIHRHNAWLKRNPGAHPAKRKHHKEELRRAHDRREKLHEKLLFWRKRWVWARNRVVFWDELLESRKRKLRRRRRNRRVDSADFRPEMTGTHESHTLSLASKAVIAIGVEVFDLWVSSTFRPETPGSHHAENPTRGADLAGEWDDMVRFQTWLFRNFLPELLELYGPDNARCADGGVPAPQAEGSPNEDLHDSHVHAFIIELVLKILRFPK